MLFISFHHFIQFLALSCRYSPFGQQNSVSPVYVLTLHLGYRVFESNQKVISEPAAVIKGLAYFSRIDDIVTINISLNECSQIINLTKKYYPTIICSIMMTYFLQCIESLFRGLNWHILFQVILFRSCRHFCNLHTFLNSYYYKVSFKCYQQFIVKNSDTYRQPIYEFNKTKPRKSQKVIINLAMFSPCSYQFLPQQMHQEW